MPRHDRLRVISFRTQSNTSAQDLFDWHTREGAFERLSPPWESVSLEDGGQGVVNGSRRVVTTKIGPAKSRWVMRHTDVVPGEQFVDQMESGPFRVWHHLHKFTPVRADSSILEDRIQFRLPLGSLGNATVGHYVESQLTRLFRYRHRTTIDDLAAHQHAKERGTMKILVTGASGLIASSLTPFLQGGGHDVVGLRRGTGKANSQSWNPATGEVDPSELAHADAVVHLAGENIGSGRWTAGRKGVIRDSRIGPTRAICESMANLPSPPQTLIVASAIGAYGDRGDEWLDEESAFGNGFLAELVDQWERATEPATRKGIRVVNLRFGIILTPKGGALQRMLLPFKFMAGGVIGSGRQYWSWVGIDDVIGAIHHALVDSSLSGPVNVVAPNPVTNREFTKSLGRVLSRPTVLPLPAFAARLALGEMADELLLASARVRPTKLLKSGYQFRHTDLESALRHVLGR